MRAGMVALATYLPLFAIELAGRPTATELAAGSLTTGAIAVSILIGERIHELGERSPQVLRTAERRRSIERGIGAARAEALLAAASDFLRCENPDELARATLRAATLVCDEPERIMLVLVDELGRPRVAGASGMTDLDRVMHVAAADPSLREPLLVGIEQWPSGDMSDDARARLGLLHAATGFTLPIRSPERVLGFLACVYERDRTFDEAFRETARSLVGQVALAMHLQSARSGQRQSDVVLRRLVRITETLLAASARLGARHELPDVLQTLADATRDATGASYAVVQQLIAGEERLSLAAASGFAPPVRERLARLRATPRRFRAIDRILAGEEIVLQAPFNPRDVPAAIQRGANLSALVAAPIEVAGRPWGYLGIGAVATDTCPLDTARELISGLATIAGDAIGRAEAVGELARASQALEAHVSQRTLQLSQAVRELRLASELKNEFLANVSHELRTPLTAILGFSDVLVKGLDGQLSAEQLEDARAINEGSRRLLGLIDDLIDISKIEAGRIELRPRHVDLGRLLRDAVDEIRPLAGEKGIALRVQANPLPTSIRADPARLHEIVLNLLSNAVKFTPAGGIVRVEACREGTNDVEGFVAIAVVDSGIGIAPDDQERIFEKFQRAAGPAYPGTGLGLSIAREFARLHGGTLAVESTSGMGSRFVLRLPMAGPPPALPHGQGLEHGLSRRNAQGSIAGHATWPLLTSSDARPAPAPLERVLP